MKYLEVFHDGMSGFWLV